MTYEEVFTQIKSIFMEADVSGEKEHLAFQFNVTGDPEKRKKERKGKEHFTQK